MRTPVGLLEDPQHDPIRILLEATRRDQDKEVMVVLEEVLTVGMLGNRYQDPESSSSKL